MRTNWIIFLVAAVILALLILFFLQKRSVPEIKPVSEASAAETAVPEMQTETLDPLPDSLLYYGEIKKIEKDETGGLTTLVMDSPKDGLYAMNLSEDTLYIDSGERVCFDKEILQEGDRVYVFHSPIAARSMPPQSQAYAILRNIPMDASCGMYHKVEALQQEDARLLITTDNGEKILSLDSKTQAVTYTGETADLAQISQDSHIIAWYWDRGEDVLQTSHVMILP